MRNGALYAYLSKGEYPSYYDANKKRILRRKAENFRIDNGELFYVGKKKVTSLKSREE